MTMAVLAIGSSLSGVGSACLGTLIRYRSQGLQAYLLLTPGRATKDVKEGIEKTGVRIHFADRFDRSEVTQDNVNVLRGVIEKLKPAIVFIPSIRVCDKKKQVLAKSALLACRSVSNVLMYETDPRNRDFRPSVYSSIAGEALVKSKALAAGGKEPSSRLRGQVESFESHRMVLNDAF